MKKVLSGLILTFLIIAMSTPAYAVRLTDNVEDRDFRQMRTKFLRGATNVVTAPLEMKKQMCQEMSKSGDHPAEKIVTGFGSLFKGIAWTIGRAGSGVFDMLTFNLSVPDGYEPLMKPDYVCEKNSDSSEDMTEDTGE